jgi:uncharacterized RDD family membrane protein YckC
MNTNYAGFWLRFVALIIDLIIIGVIRGVFIIPLLAMMGIGLANDIQNMDVNDPASVVGLIGTVMAAASVVTLISTIVWVLYYTFLESSKLQASIGKLALGLIVTDSNGARLDFGKALVRNVCKIISSLILCIGFIMAAFTDKKQALHDIIANTLVVKKPK